MTITASRVQRHLAELNIWLKQIEALTQSTIDPHTGNALANNTPNPDTLPFGIEHRLDNTDDGPQGVRTADGAREIIKAWAISVATAHYQTTGAMPALFNPIETLKDYAHWAHDNYADWESMAEEIDQLRNWAAKLAGYGDIPIAQCPRCHGTITTTPADNGIPEHGACTTCDHWYADQNAITLERDRLLTQQLKTSNDPTLYAPLTTIKRLHPTLHRKTLNQWVKRGHVKRAQHGYQLAPINSRMGTVP